jgi:hypothetical protein
MHYVRSEIFATKYTLHDRDVQDDRDIEVTNLIMLMCKIFFERIQFFLSNVKSNGFNIHKKSVYIFIKFQVQPASI